jgi:hypothetical protein
MSNDSQSDGKTRHITFGFVIAWVFAVVVGVPGIMMLFEHQVGAGILLIIAALVALPPVNSFIKNKAHLSLSGGLRVAAVIVLCIIAGVVLSQESGSGAVAAAPAGGSTQAASEQPAAPAPIKLTATVLYNAYTNNEVAADAKYKGNLVEVTGVINSIGKDILGNPYVSLNVGEYSELGVQCIFPKADESTLTSLSSGQSITLEGTVTGETLTLVGLDGCSIVK